MAPASFFCEPGSTASLDWKSRPTARQEQRRLGWVSVISRARLFKCSSCHCCAVVHLPLLRCGEEGSAPSSPPWLAFQCPTPRIATCRVLEGLSSERKRRSRDIRT